MRAQAVVEPVERPAQGAGGTGSGDAGAGAGSGGAAQAVAAAGGGPAAKPAPQEPSIEARTEWDRLPESEKAKRAVFYIGTGKPFSAGRVYMVSVKGNILGSVGLRFAPAGMAFHTKSMEDCGLVMAIPRDFGRIMRIDKIRQCLDDPGKGSAPASPCGCGNSRRIR